MPDTPIALARSRRSVVLDSLTAALIAVPGLVVIALAPAGFARDNLAATGVLVVCAWAIIGRRRWPVAAALAVAFAYVVAVYTPILAPTATTVAANVAVFEILLTIVVLAYSLGGMDALSRSLPCLLVVIVATQWGPNGDGINPLPVVLIIGAWTVGRVVRSQRRIAAALEVRGAELEAERDRYAIEAVRYERARIAREIHDIVAHCMSVVVIQAAAGRRLDPRDRPGSDAVLATISELARHAEADVAALTRLLSQDAGATHRLSREVIDELIKHAAATGTAIEVSVTGDLDAIAPPASVTLHRVLQEGLTNAFKHAPGAPISVAVECTEESARLDIRNQPALGGASLLSGHSGGNGLRGLSERMGALAGTLHAGPTAPGGWQVSACVPSGAVRAHDPIPNAV